ncbi:MAG: hypothetical protein Q7R79_02790 [bacterium]|nr:hypothetical protein [bacterium]
MKKIVGLKDLRENIDVYVGKVQKGESFTVVRRSKPLFTISPVETEDSWETIVDFTKIRKGGVPIEDILKKL